MTSPRTVVVLLNWNGAPDTIDCIESLLAMDEQDFLVVLCDNLSADGSFERLRSWGERRLTVKFATWVAGQQPPVEAKVILIQTGANLGFAGGCNVGLRFALLYTTAEYIWLLNNDTVVNASSLAVQMESMRQKKDVGILGSTLIYFNEPSRIQAAAGYDFNFWTARVLPPLQNLSLARLPSELEVEKRLKYISGASMFVRRSFLETVGLLNEQYFLYFEEIDWAVRGGNRFKLGFCSQSRVLHKEGSSIGSHRSQSLRSDFSERYLTRSRILFLKTYYPGRLAVCLLWLCGVVVIRIARGRWKLAKAAWRGALDGLAAPVLPIPAVTEWPQSMRDR